MIEYMYGNVLRVPTTWGPCAIRLLLDHMIACIVLKNPIQEGATIDRVEIIQMLQAFKLS